MAATESNRQSDREWQAKAWDGEDAVEEAQLEGDLSVGHRLVSWKSIASFGFAAVVLLFVILKGGINPHALWTRLSHMNPLWFAGAFLIYYATFPIRGYRWQVLIQNAYHGDRQAVKDMSVAGLTEILFISWFVNCVVPAKLGDLYRAYLAKLWVKVSWTKTVGTIMAERIVDILILSFLMAGTGFIVFRGRLGHVSTILVLGVALAIVGVLLLVAMKTLSHRIHQFVPERFLPRYASFEEGTLQSFRRIPLLLFLTCLIWFMEGGRLQMVFTALGLHEHISTIPFAPMLFLALGTAVLTTVPFTPGGLGLVEAGLGSLMVYLGVLPADAAAVVVLDRILSYYSIAFLGFLVYLFSKRSHFRQHV